MTSHSRIPTKTCSQHSLSHKALIHRVTFTQNCRNAERQNNIEFCSEINNVIAVMILSRIYQISKDMHRILQFYILVKDLLLVQGLLKY